MARYTIEFKGIDEVQRALGISNSKRMKRQIDDDLSEGIDRMAEQAYDNAPVETGALRSSILASRTKLSRHHYMFGSTMPYAQRQEYEHKSKMYYFKRAVLQEAPGIKEDIESTVKRTLNG